MRVVKFEGVINFLLSEWELIREGGLIRINWVKFRIPPRVTTPCGMTINEVLFSYVFGVFVWCVCICVCVFF